MTTAPQNGLLATLPSEELERLEPYLRRVPLAPRQRLASSGEPMTQVVFIETGAVSRVVHLLTGETVEAGIIGSEGLVGVALALGRERAPTVCTVQLPGSALVMQGADFEEHVRRTGGPLLQALTVYANLSLEVLCQLTACHCLHRIEQRLCRCLLTLSDHSEGNELRITHDTLAEFLGVHRPSITYALQAIAAHGAIALERRRVRVTNREALRAHACECYNAIRSTTARELGYIREMLAA